LKISQPNLLATVFTDHSTLISRIGVTYRHDRSNLRHHENTQSKTFIGRCEITEVQACLEAPVVALSLNKHGAAVAGPVRSKLRKSRSAIGSLGLASWAHFFHALQPAVRLILIGSSILLTAGCATISPRNVLPQASASRIEVEGFHNIRFWGDASAKEIQSIMMAEAHQTDTRRSLGLERHPPVSNLLAISGGAEDGAFGAGLLVGWGDAGTRPPFDLVTGVSSGALIAPFAFLGREHDSQLREIFTKYGRKDVFTYNVHGLLEGSSLTDDAPLAKLIETYVDDAFIQEVARERIKGRILLIGTTNLDTQRPVLWDMGRIAMSNNHEATVLFRKILLASATLPGVFPPVRIQVRVGGQNYDELHVDGGVTRQVFIAPSVLSFASHDQNAARPAPKPRLYVIRNGKIDPEWQSVGENVLSITQRSISTLIKNQGIGDLYRIYSVTKRDGIDFNLASVPPDFAETSDEPFDQKYMVALFDRGYDLARHNYAWAKAPPGMEPTTQAHN
jgi:predicted acylesterase/phospholipase RssA